MTAGRRRLLLALAATLLLAAALPDQALAHGLVGRQDLPIPKWLFGWGASVVLVASFVGLSVLWQRPRIEQATERRLFSIPGFVVGEVICGAIGVALFVLVVYAGFAGAPLTPNNFSPTFALVIFWVGFVPASVLFGDVFRAFNPWRAIARACAWAAGKASRGGLPEPLPYPERLGRWPAVAMILVFVWFELIHYFALGVPQDIAVASLIYAAVQFIGMAIYGVEQWGRYADGFSVYFGLFARISALRWERGTVYARMPLSGLTSLDIVPGTVPLLCAMIGTTSFDGFSQGPLWASIQLWLVRSIHGLGIAQETSINVADTIGLVGCVTIIYGLYRLGASGMRRDTNLDLATRALGGRFAHSLVPIAVAYVTAHYFSSLVYQGQAIFYLASDPLGHGSDLFGTANRAIDYTWVTATAIWYVQVAALVVGHIGGLMLAHDRALITFENRRLATRSQYWMLGVMIVFTSLGLWLLSAEGS